MNPNKALWEKGDFTKIAAAMRGAGEALVGRIGVSRGMKVLDLACGDGTTALPEARAGAEVLGVDISAPLVAAGNKRVQEMGLTNITFQEGDACALTDLQDKTFDLVVSIFGAMFAPKPMDVAKEMVRVTKPGGRVVMGNWIPNDPSMASQLLKISSAYAPPPPEGFISPMLWGVEEHIKERFVAAGIAPDKIKCERDVFVFKTSRTPAQYVDDFRRFYGPTMNAFAAAEQNGKADQLNQELVALFNSINTATDGSTNIPANFMRVTVNV